MPNPQPTGTGEGQGLDAAQSAGTPLPGRTARSTANDAANKIRPDQAEGHADARIDLERDPWEMFR